MKEKVYAGIMGLVVGDALGVPFEFKQRDTFKCEGMTGWGTYNQPPGTWSDDSSLTLATLESIGRLGWVIPDDIMQNFFRWYFNAEFTPHGEVFDIGRTTRQAIERYRYGTPAIKCGGKGEMDNGNGALMRILPLAFTNCEGATIKEVCALTHNHDISKAACLYYVSMARSLFKDDRSINITQDAMQYVIDRMEEVPKEFFERIADLWGKRQIKSTGYVVDTLEAARWCLITSNSYKDCVLRAVNLGGDTDTIAAVAGGLAGLLYGVGGEKGIPTEWIDQIARKEYIRELCEGLTV